MERPNEPQPPTNEELLANAEKYIGWARNNYGKRDNEFANTATWMSIAGSMLVIARKLNEQAMPLPDDMAGPNGDAL